MPQAGANVVSQNLLVSTLRKEISWKARLRGASTSRARAKVWAQLPGAGPRLGGASSRVWGPRLGWGLGPGPTGLGGSGPQGCDQFFVVLKSPGRGLAKGWESAE